MTPFSDALELTMLAPGSFSAELVQAWTVGGSESTGGKQHGGLMLALVAKAGLAELDRRSGGPACDPLAVSANYLRAPELGPVALRAEVVKLGRTASVVDVTLSQQDRVIITATVTGGRLPDAPAEWSGLPDLSADPPPDGIPTTKMPVPAPLAQACDVVLDPDTASFCRDEVGDPVLRGWVRPIGEQPDPLFALLAGDILPPLLFNLGLPGWAPTVQLTALIRARPAPGWLRLESSTITIAGGWLDEDMIVIDAEGKLICQARQLAMAPLG